MGTGKTEVSKALATRLDRKRLCLDDMIEQRANKPISDIFKQDGEPHFRKLESEMVSTASKEKSVVIDTGGGAIVNEENLKNLKKTGIIFCLTASVDTIIERTKKFTHRPLLNAENPYAKITELLKGREKFYQKADYSIDTTNMTIEQVVDGIIKKI